MLKLRLILFFIGIIQVQVSFSQSSKSPMDFFNEAAHHYIAEDKLNAIKTLNTGLKAHKDNEEMRKLAEEFFKKLEEEQKQKQKKQDKQEEDQKSEEQNKEQENKENTRE